jgi:hypothetical protein
MYDRFDLESAIMKAWQTSDDLKDVSSALYDTEVLDDKDRLGNILIGIEHLHELRMQKVMDIFSDLVTNQKIH